MSATPRQTLVAAFEFGDECDFENFCDAVAACMGRHEQWHITGRNIDWRGRDGTKTVHADSPRALLAAFHSEDILRLYRANPPDAFAIIAPTHDTPTGSYYTFKPIPKESTIS